MPDVQNLKGTNEVDTPPPNVDHTYLSVVPYEFDVSDVISSRTSRK